MPWLTHVDLPNNWSCREETRASAVHSACRNRLYLQEPGAVGTEGADHGSRDHDALAAREV